MTDKEEIAEISEVLYEYLRDIELGADEAMSCAALLQTKICALAIKNQETKQERAELVKDIEQSFNKQTEVIMNYLNELI